MSLDDAKTLIEIIAGIVTSIGIVIAGIWSYYVFVFSRTFAPNVRIGFNLKQISDFADYKTALITVTISNIGRRRVKKADCWIATRPIDKAQDEMNSLITRLDTPLELSLSRAKLYSIFEDHNWLEPGEEATEDVLFALNGLQLFKVGVIFISQKKKWASSAIIDTQIRTEGGEPA